LKHFRGRVALITGAGSGFGREFALEAARLGMKLVLVDVQAGALAETENLIAGLAGAPVSKSDVLSRPVDVRSTSGMEALADEVFSRFGNVHLLFNNAGVAHGGLLWEHSVSDWEWVLGVNVWGVVHGIRCFVPRMLAQGDEGHIINTASVAGLVSAPMMGVYAVSKHSVVTLSETLFHDLALVNSKLHCSVLCPAFVPTGIHLSDRNRPEDVSPAQTETASMRAARANADKAVTSGKISAAEVIQITFQAVRDQQFYIVTHEKMMPSIALRCEDVMQRRNPSNPFTYKPELLKKPA
jgi:NAD(P)-dependent dehydrogenase (short-subunit alcohol dehydrogenase family)